jgi:NhaA family Na+:H+ antiporter
MVVPALIYLALNFGSAGDRGWGIPMATDIAFAIGVLTLLGTRVPLSLKVFLLALAIADDLGAIAVIAVFYTDQLDYGWLAAAIATFTAVAVIGRMGVRDLIVYVALGSFAWLAVYESGVHATVAGVVLGLLTPINALYNTREVQRRIITLADDLRLGETPEAEELRVAALSELEELARESQPVSDRLEEALHPWTSYLIVPIFALANAGVVLSGAAIADAAESRISWGVALGLIAGKPAGILLFSFAAARAGLGSLPERVTWAMLAGASMLAGIGFTVSLFITDLAFDEPSLIDDAKIGILAGSVVMGVAGLLFLRVLALEKNIATDVREAREEAPTA